MRDVIQLELFPIDRKVLIRVIEPGAIRTKQLSSDDGCSEFEISGLGDNDIQMMLRATGWNTETGIAELIRLGQVAAAIQQRSGLDGIMLIKDAIKLDATDFVVVRNEALKILYPECFQK